MAEVVRYIRRRDDILSVTTIVYDPLYLTEPLVRSTEYRNTPSEQLGVYPCYATTEIIRDKGEVPHYLLGEHPQQNEYSFRFQVPLHAARGGAETMYPEFQDRARDGGSRGIHRGLLAARIEIPGLSKLPGSKL